MEEKESLVKEGKYLDAWDSGDKIPMFYFSKD